MFIVLEGIDGCGKTTQARRLAARLEASLGAGRVVLTAEPGGWDGGRALRELILSTRFESAAASYLMFVADRCEHAAKVIRPALGAGRTVVCDRYTPSTIAYQLYGERVDEGTRDALERMTHGIGLPVPDAVVLLDIEPRIARERLEARGALDRYDAMGADHFARVREGYLAQMERADASRWLLVDASQSMDDVSEAVARGLDEMTRGAVQCR